MTKLILNKDVEEIRKHVNGRRFKHRLHDFELRKSKPKSEEFDYASLEDEDGVSKDELDADNLPEESGDDVFEVVPIEPSSDEENAADEMDVEAESKINLKRSSELPPMKRKKRKIHK